MNNSKDSIESQTRKDVEKALDSLTGNRKAKFYLRRALDKETEYFEVNGHIFHPNPEELDASTSKWCRVGYCEMSHPAHAETASCPANMEGHSWQRSSDYIVDKEREWKEEHDWGLDNE